MELNLRLCVVLVVLSGDVLAEDDVIQAVNTNILSPDRRAAVKERCQNIRRDCIATGDIFRRSVVCGGGGKRFINECALQLRSCDLLLDTGEEILQERCLWMVLEEKPTTALPEIITLSKTVTPVVDHFFTTSEAHESTIVTSHRPSTVVGDFFHWYSTTERQTTQQTTANPSTEVATTSRNEQPTNFVTDHGGVRFSRTPFHHFPWTPEFTTGESGFRPPDEVNIRDCCRGDTPCKSCLRQDKGGKVCGSDGKTYDTECALDNYACDTGKEELAVQSKGSCPSKGGKHRSTKPPPPAAPPRGDLGKR